MAGEVVWPSMWQEHRRRHMRLPRPRGVGHLALQHPHVRNLPTTPQLRLRAALSPPKPRPIDRGVLWLAGHVGYVIRVLPLSHSP